MSRRFPPPWSVEEMNDACFIIRDKNGQALAYVYNLLRLPWPAPDITAAIINGRQPPQFNAMKLMRQASRLPVNWSEQRTLLGFC
jgi:site-specific DNA recombinase